MRNPGRGGPPSTRGPRLSSVRFVVRDAMYFLIIQYEISNSVANRLRLPLSNTPPPSTTRHNCRKNSHRIICPLFRPHLS